MPGLEFRSLVWDSVSRKWGLIISFFNIDVSDLSSVTLWINEKELRRKILGDGMQTKSLRELKVRLENKRFHSLGMTNEDFRFRVLVHG